jgi:hypothetical protein
MARSLRPDGFYRVGVSEWIPSVWVKIARFLGQIISSAALNLPRRPALKYTDSSTQGLRGIFSC